MGEGLGNIYIYYSNTVALACQMCCTSPTPGRKLRRSHAQMQSPQLQRTLKIQWDGMSKLARQNISKHQKIQWDIYIQWWCQYIMG